MGRHASLVDRARKGQHLDTSVPARAGIGEHEAISLALEVEADILLIDDRAGRQAAEARMLPIAGTLAVLLQAALSQRLDLPVALARLRGSGFRASPAVVAAYPGALQRSQARILVQSHRAEKLEYTYQKTFDRMKDKKIVGLLRNTHAH